MTQANPIADLGMALQATGQRMRKEGWCMKTPLSNAIEKQKRAIDKAICEIRNAIAPIDETMARRKLAKAKEKLTPLIIQLEKELASRKDNPADYENCPYGNSKVIWRYGKLCEDAKFSLSLNWGE